MSVIALAMEFKAWAKWARGSVVLVSLPKETGV